MTQASSIIRKRTPEETLALVRPHFSRLGITRVGLVTGLDRLGVPIGFAARPNGLSLSVHQGRGLDPASAMISAAMEAVEVALSEKVRGDVALTLEAAEQGPTALLDLQRVTRAQIGRADRTVPLPFCLGHDLMTDQPILVPAALVATDHTTASSQDIFDRSSDGLASGNDLTEALCHGLLELIERDAAALARALPLSALTVRKRAPGFFASPVLDTLMEHLRQAGLALALLDITTDIGLPVAAAMIAPEDLTKRPDLTAAAVCGGFACHPDPAMAAIRAITEACQARLTAVAGARDDIGAAWYQRTTGNDASMTGFAALFAAEPSCPEEGPPAIILPGASAETLLADIVARLAARRIRQVAAVPIPSGIDGIAAVRVVVPGLEIGPGAAGRHIGARLLAAMLRRAA